MEKQFEIEDNGEVKQISIEPSMYQDKHLYEIRIDDDYIMMYQEGEKWKHNQEYELNPKVLEQIVQKIEEAR